MNFVMFEIRLETFPVLYHQSWDLQSDQGFSFFRKCHAAEVPHKRQFVQRSFTIWSQWRLLCYIEFCNSIGILSTLYTWNSRKRQVNNCVEAAMIFKIILWCLICAVEPCGSEQPNAYVSEVKCTDKTNCWFMHFNEATVSIWFQF